MISEDQIERFITAVETIGYQLKQLGNGDNDGMGAVEHLSVKIQAGLNGIANTLDEKLD